MGKVNIDFDELLDKHDEVSKRIQSILYFVLSVILYFFLVLSISDTSMIENNWLIKLPFFNTDINKSNFLIFGPIALYFSFLYLHSFVEHKLNVEKIIIEEFNVDVIESTKLQPTIFNFRNRLTKNASTFFIYFLIPLFIFYFLFESLNSSSFFIVSAVLVVSLITTTWKYNAYSYRHKFKQKFIYRLILFEILFVAIFTFTIYIINGKSQYKYHVENAILSYRNFSFQDLTKTNFTRANFQGAILVNSNLSSSNFTYANFKDANMENAVIKDVLCTGALFENTNLTHATIDNVDFTNAIIDNSNFFASKMNMINLTGAYVTYSDLTQVDFGDSAILVNTQFYGSILTGAGLSYANLAKACLRSEASWAIMDSADLTYANAVGTKMVGTKLKNAILNDISFEGAVLIVADLNHAELQNAGLNKTLLHGTNLSYANLTNANLTSAQFNSINSDKFPWETYKYGATGIDTLIFPLVQTGGITGPANLDSCDLKNAILDNANFSGVNLTKVKHLKLDQIVKAIGNIETQLPTELKDRESVIREAWSSKRNK